MKEWVDAHHSSTPNILQHAISTHTPLPVIHVPETHCYRKIFVRLASLPNPPYSIDPPAPKMPVIRRGNQSGGDAVSQYQVVQKRQNVVNWLLEWNRLSPYPGFNEQVFIGIDSITDIFDRYMYFTDPIASTDAFFKFHSTHYYRTNTLKIGYGVTSCVYEVRRQCDEHTRYVVKVFTGDIWLGDIIQEVVKLWKFRYYE